MGIEPTLSAWEAEVLPLNYTRLGQDSTCVKILVKPGCEDRFDHHEPAVAPAVTPVWL